MKKIFLILIISFYITACKAQQSIPKIASDKVKVNNTNYRLIRPNNKVTQIINTNNKLTNVKQVAPNLPLDIPIPAYSKFDKKLLIQICAEAIPLNKLQKLPQGYDDDIYIYMKINTKGEPLEMGFLVSNTSLITPNEIQQIEEKIMKSSFKVTFKHGIEQYFDGANYFNINIWIKYSDILKAKEIS